MCSIIFEQQRVIKLINFAFFLSSVLHFLKKFPFLLFFILFSSLDIPINFEKEMIVLCGCARALLGVFERLIDNGYIYYIIKYHEKNKNKTK